ncbi:MAG TPA: BatA domain-containing protein, partial [Micavibrio sp.]
MNFSARAPLKEHFKKAAAATGMMATPALAQAAQLGPVTFDASPWMLLAIPATAALWWLMKSTPRKPVQHIVPHIKLLYKLASREQTPRRVPWWQYAAVATAVAGTTAALTQPRYNPEAPLTGAGPVMLVVDNDWAGARDWKSRQEQMQQMIDRADKAGRAVIIVPTAAPADGTAVRVHGPMPASTARNMARTMAAQSWPVNYQATLKALQQQNKSAPGTVVWLSNGLDHQDTKTLATTLQTFGTLSVYEDDPAKAPYLLGAPDTTQADLSIPVNRVPQDKPEKLVLVAQDEKGMVQGHSEMSFKAGEAQAIATFKMPKEARNAVTRVAIAQHDHIGGQLLVDERFRRRSVGIIENSHDSSSDPLTDENHYLTQALSPAADIKTGAADHLLENKLAVLVMGDSATVTQAQKTRIDKWVREEGGTLIRFAGPRLAQAISEGVDDALLPQPMSQTRTLGNQTTGADVGRIKAFAPSSPFKNIAPAPEVQITQQILPRAGAADTVKVWAQLEDQTPLVSARASGKGQIIFVH